MSVEAIDLELIREVHWGDIREQVLKLIPKLASAIDELSPDNSLSFSLVKYPFGAEILKKGLFYLPVGQNKLLPITDSTIKKSIQKRLGYNLCSNPVTLVLNKSVELFINIEGRAVPLYGYGPVKRGKLFGVQRILNPITSHHPKFIWDMTSGARSIFMLAKISEHAGHEKLKKSYGVKQEAPIKLTQHWQIFKEIASNPRFPEPWYTELLFFSNNWFEKLEDKAWLTFKNALFHALWDRGDFNRNHFFWELMFSFIREKLHLHPSSFVNETVKYLLSISAGASPGFVPATHSELLPLEGLQRVYLQEYNLKENHPNIMQPDLFSFFAENPMPVYYSRKYSVIPEPLNKREGVAKELGQILKLLQHYKAGLISNQFNIENTPLYEAASKTKFDFFHINQDEYHGIQESKNIMLSDNRFLTPVAGMCYVGQFPAYSPFFNGCIRISKES